MNTSTAVSNDPANLLREGWKVLVEHLGLPQATQFVVLLERGKGDSVAEVAEFWGDTDVDNIHRRILEWKKR